MSIDFNANQYENAFLPHKLQNYQIPKGETKRPDKQEGFTTVIASDRGHLLPGQPRSRESPWGTFVGTWDLPDKMPIPCKINPTARREDMVEKLCADKFEKEMIISGKLKRCKVPPPLKVQGDVEATAACTAVMMPMEPERCRSGAEAPCPAMTAAMDASANAERAASQHWHHPPTVSPKPPTPVVDPPVQVTLTPKPPSPAVVHSPKVASPVALAPTPKVPTPTGLKTPKPGPESDPHFAAGNNPVGVDWPMPKSVTPHLA